jgi:hypothetical protein
MTTKTVQKAAGDAEMKKRGTALVRHAATETAAVTANCRDRMA